jgi:hypothetical protein
MNSWHVYVGGNQISVGVELTFTPSMIIEGEPDPPVTAGDSLEFEFPNNDRSSGTVIEVGDEQATIRERDTGAWMIRPAAARRRWVIFARG